MVSHNPDHSQAQHPRQTAPNPFPAFARADGGCQLVAGKAQAKSPACKIRKDVSHPHQGEHRQQEIDTEDARLHHGKPRQPQRQHTQNDAHRRRNERPARHTGAQQPGGACHPKPAAQRPQQRQRAIQPASPPTASTQGQAHSRQAQGGCIAAPIQAPPLPGTSRHEDQNHQGKRSDGGIEQRWQQDGQQDQGSDDAL